MCAFSKREGVISKEKLPLLQRGFSEKKSFVRWKGKNKQEIVRIMVRSPLRCCVLLFPRNFAKLKIPTRDFPRKGNRLTSQKRNPFCCTKLALAEEAAVGGRKRKANQSNFLSFPSFCCSLLPSLPFLPFFAVTCGKKDEKKLLESSLGKQDRDRWRRRRRK